MGMQGLFNKLDSARRIGWSAGSTSCGESCGHTVLTLAARSFEGEC